MKIKYEHILILCLIGIIITLVTCKRTVPKVTMPEVVPVERIVERIKVDSVSINRLLDSTSRRIKTLTNYSERLEGWLAGEREISKILEADNNELVNQINDERIKEELLSTGKKMKDNSQLKDSLCDESISALKQSNEVWGLSYREKEKQRKLLSLSVDTLLSNQRLLETALKKSMPRNKLLIGFTCQVTPDVGIGPKVQFMHKSGWAFDASSFLFKKGVIIGAAKVISLKK